MDKYEEVDIRAFINVSWLPSIGQACVKWINYFLLRYPQCCNK